MPSVFNSFSRAKCWWVVPIVVLLVFQRWGLAELTQWREDQATNLWIGTQVWHAHYFPSVGLISSVGTPNPSGMPWLGFLLAPLPSLHAISFVLSLVQLALLARLCCHLGGSVLSRMAAFVASAACLQVVLTSVEFWNQWIVGLLNLIFLTELLKLRRRAAPFGPLVIIANCALAAPALYIAGVVNSATFVLLIAFVLWRNPVTWKSVFGTLGQKGFWTGTLIVHALVIWLPYSQTVNANTIHGLSKMFTERLAEIFLTIVRLPLAVNSLLPKSLIGLDQDSPAILSAAVYRESYFSGAAIGMLLIFSVAGALWKRKLPETAWLFFFCIIMCIFSPLLGGFAWGLGQRPDQVAQFFPVLLVVAFASFQEFPRFQVPVLAIALVYFGVQLTESAQLHQSFTRYRGPEMTDADLPLSDRRRAIDFIAQDWKARTIEGNSETGVPIYYAFGTAWTPLIARFGAELAQWYSDEPYTIGRSYDWELARRWRLRNQDEGLAQTERQWHGQRYTISMVGAPTPSFLPDNVSHREFGRVRVSIVDSR